MPRILIADDNPVSLEFFATVLRERGYECQTAVDGAQALEAAHREHFDLLLFDLDMPQLSGREVLRRLHADHSARSHATPAIATSAEMNKAIKHELRRCGFSETLPKPVDIATLNQVIESVLVRASAELSRVSLADGSAISAAPRNGRDDNLLDDAQALSACGDAGIAQALRTLFASELDTLPAELQHYAATSDTTALRDRLHRLRASCGFCGAAALNDACLAMRDFTDPSAPSFNAALLHLIDVAAMTRIQLLAANCTFL